MSIYKRYVRKHPEMENDDLADILMEDERISAKRRCVLQSIRRAKRQLSEKNPDQIEAENYLFDGESYAFDDIEVPKHIMQKMCEWYPYKGSDMNQSEVCERAKREFGFDISTKVFGRVCRALEFTKTSYPIAPHIRSEEAVTEVLESVGKEKIETSLRDREYKAYRKLYRKEVEKTLEVEAYTSSVLESVETLSFPEVPALELNDSLKPCDYVIQLGDWHVGKLVDNKFNKYNRDVFFSRIQQLKQEIYEYFIGAGRPAKSLRFVFVGDALDGVSGDMHHGQSVGQDLHFGQQPLVAARGASDVIAFGSAIHPGVPVHVDMVSGNHDRVSSNRDVDKVRMGGQWFYQLTREMCPATAEWTLHDDIVGDFTVGGVQVILTHGERCPKNLRDVVWAHLDDKANYHLVLTGHYHSFNAEETAKVLTVRSGSLCGADNYAIKNLAKMSLPSQNIIAIRKGLPRPQWIPLT